MSAGGPFGPKITFDRISRHFRSMRNFYFFYFFHKMAAGVIGSVVQLNFFGPMNSLKYKVFWWIWLPMGSLKKSSRVVLITTFGKNIYMQISAAIIENRISSITFLL